MMVGEQVSRYRVLAKVAGGEDISLYRARDVSSGKEVALWIAKGPAGIPTLPAASSLKHPHLAPILDHGVEGEVFYVAQEIGEGKTLKQLLADGPLPVRRALRIGTQIALALSEAHRHGLVHDNLSSWAIFLSEGGEARVLGLGLAGTAGDPDYFSPERAQDQPVDSRSDIFSLGTVLYEALTGYLPFTGENRSELIKSVVYEPPPRMRVARPELPAEVEKIVFRCLSKIPGERYPSGEALIDDLLHLALEKPRALAPARPGRTRALALCAAVALLVGIPVTWFFLADSGPARLPRDAGPYTGWERVAVMEPRYVGKDPSRHYIVQGITDEVVSALSANTSLDVISTLSTRVYSNSTKPAVQIAQELVADGLIESTLIDDPAGMKLHIRLTDAKTGNYLWDHKLDISEEDIFKIQHKVEGVLYAEFAPVWVRTRDHLQRAGTVEAYTLFLEGKQLFSLYGIQENREAIEKFQEALKKDPYFAPAWAALARAYGNIVNLEENLDPEWLEKAEQAAQKAIDVAPVLPDGYHARGTTEFFKYAYFGNGDRTKVESDFDKALKLSPDYPDALLSKAVMLYSRGMELDEMSLIERSLPFYQRALALQPNLPNPESNYAEALARSGQIDLGKSRLERALKINPDSVRPYISLATVSFVTGDTERAIEATLEALRRDPSRTTFYQSRLAAFYAAAGEQAKAREALGKLPSSGGSAYDDFYIASALAGMGREEEALSRLEAWKRSMEQRKEQIGQLRWWLRKDPNFKKLRERGALEQYLRKESRNPV